MTPSEQILTPDQLASLVTMQKKLEAAILGQKITLQDMGDYRKALAEIQHTTPPHAQTMAEVGASYWNEIRLWSQAAHTGHTHLDTLLGGGFLPGRLYALLGAPGSGKTSLAIQWAVNIADTGRPVVYLTSEDSPHQLYCRTLARLSDLDYGYLLRGIVKEEILTRAMNRYNERTSANTLLIVDHAGAFSIDGLEAVVSAHTAKFPEAGPPIVVIDYLQRMARSSVAMQSMDIRQAVTSITESLREYAKRANVAMLVLASQNRVSYGPGGNGNALASAKESGDIEYTADVLAALVKDKERVAAPGGDTMTVKVDKNRQGMTAEIKLDYMKRYQRFDEVPQ